MKSNNNYCIAITLTLFFKTLNIIYSNDYIRYNWSW